LDLVRPRVWDDPAVEFWYRQNAFVAVNHHRADLLERAASLLSTPPPTFDVVHPAMLAQQEKERRNRQAPEQQHSYFLRCGGL
jgi:hypothetical protein